ncbi:MAG: CCA tRNA nucleotidyltransferase, partial [Campylobacter hyointestinalis]
WLVLNTKKRISLAKELGFYDKKFSPVIDISAANGLKSKELGKFIEQQKELAIKKYLRIKN